MAASITAASESSGIERNSCIIKRLEEAVVNRIAAGEVIQRPANALKEMIENSLDASSTAIQVTVKAGGLKMLQIQDNGCGIHKEDLGVVCERFTTSKLTKFEDLSSLQTYGFRGEALASISHVAHVTITTRTASSKCAFKACYSDGRLIAPRPGGVAEARPCAGNLGTIILVEDLFYNVNTRRKALKSPSEELARITDMMTRYAVHNAGISFTLKKHGTGTAELKTTLGSSIQDNIGLLYGTSVEKELLSVACEDRQLGFQMSALATNANYSMKKFNFLLFINNRLVECSPLRKALEVVYAAVLPKGSYPFIYMSITIRPDHIDVNVHPTKHEVQFLFQDKLVEKVQESLEKRLLASDSSRTYYTQTLLPGNTTLGTGSSSTPPCDKRDDREEGGREYEYNMVRTDAKERSLKAFVHPEDGSVRSKKVSAASSLATPQQRRRKSVNLTSILSLQGDIRSRRHSDLARLFSHHKFVGLVDQTRVLVQHETGLYLLDMHYISKEFFYQLVIMDFGNFGCMKLQPPAPIYELLLIALDSPVSEWHPEDGPKDILAEYALECLSSKAEMLKEYFSFEIKDGCVVALPVLLDHFSPNLDRLPHFLLCLAVEVDWDKERNCFHTFAQQCANFYCIQHDPFLVSDEGNSNANPGNTSLPFVGDVSKDYIQKENVDLPTCSANASSTRSDHTNEDCSGPVCTPDDVLQAPHSTQVPFMKRSAWQWNREHVLLPALRQYFSPPNTMATNGSVLQIADLHELYKVFERC